MRIDRRFYLPVAFVALLLDFAYLIVRNALEPHYAAGGDIMHTLFVVAGYAAWTAYLTTKPRLADTNPVQLIGRIVISAAGALLLSGGIHYAVPVEYSYGAWSLAPKNVSIAVATDFLAIVLGGAAVAIFAAIAELIFIKRRRRSRRNFIAYLAVLTAFMIASSAMPGWLPPDSAINTLLLVTATVLIVVNSFRFSWILVLTRREKLMNLLLAFFGCVFFIILSDEASFFSSNTPEGGSIHHVLFSYHPVVSMFVSSVFLFGAVYMGIGCISTLLHLPTAKEFDRKKAEISSLHNMSRLVTQVFDFDELVATVSTLALDVAEADAVWLELRADPRAFRPGGMRLADDSLDARGTLHAPRNITADQLSRLQRANGEPAQTLVYEIGKPVIIHDARTDRRLRAAADGPFPYASLALVPLTTHDGHIGLLGVAKKSPYEFDKEVLHVLYAFADMVSIALENSLLIARSIAKERLAQEIVVAQKMQRSLLPTLLPIAPTYDIAAVSIPANEVGGDYYDALQLDDRHIGLTIGDVSGKGVSAALYMAQVKGIFQSLSHTGYSPRELLVRMNHTLRDNMERNSFISLLYAVLDTETGHLVFSRAGHCPLLYISRGTSRYLRPNGMGLGLDGGERFASSIEEEHLHLEDGDVIVLYTDGVTEAKNHAGDEFQTSRLAEEVARRTDATAETITQSIVKAVTSHTGSSEHEDDITILVLRWKGSGYTSAPAARESASLPEGAAA